MPTDFERWFAYYTDDEPPELGSLILEETVSGVTCPGGVCRPGPLELGRGNLTDIVVGGTGIFEGATRTLTGTVRLEGSNALLPGRALSSSRGRSTTTRRKRWTSASGRLAASDSGAGCSSRKPPVERG